MKIFNRNVNTINKIKSGHKYWLLKNGGEHGYAVIFYLGLKTPKDNLFVIHYDDNGIHAELISIEQVSGPISFDAISYGGLPDDFRGYLKKNTFYKELKDII